MSTTSSTINKATALFVDRALEREYLAYSSQHEADRERAVLYFATTLYLAYSVLDYLVLTHAATEAILIRLVCGFAAYCLITATKHKRIEPLLPLIASAIMVVGSLSISFFIWREGSIDPPYYVGIIVVVLLFATLVRGYFIVSLLSYIPIYASYVLATLSVPKGSDYIASQFFLTHSLIFCSSAIYVLEIKRREQFLQYHKTVKLNAQLQIMVEEANVSLKRKNALLNILTHVFRTPLHQIIGYAQILEQEALGKQQHQEYVEYSSHILGAGENLLRLTQRLMKYGRLETGTKKTSPQKLPVNELISCATSAIQDSANSKNITFAYEKVKLAVYADCTLIEDAVIEILQNAIDASPEGGKVSIMAESLDPDKISIRIQDQGPGIDDEQLTSIRNPIELTDEFLSVSEKLGLGVTLAERIIALHNGEIHFKRAEDAGTIVELTIPQYKKPEAREDSTEKQARQATEEEKLRA